MYKERLPKEYKLLALSIAIVNPDPVVTMLTILLPSGTGKLTIWPVL
jgi:hypothetical protein